MLKKLAISAVAALTLSAGGAMAAGGAGHVEDVAFSFEGPFGKFDQILIADCLFFENFHIDLVYTLKQLAHAETEVLIAAPERG